MTTQFQLPVEISHGNVEAVLAQGIAAIDTLQGENQLTINCQALSVFDSSALSVILSMRRHAQIKCVDIKLQSIPEKLASLAQVYGVADVVLV
ncbi:STAS domain-containing protein [Polynucleobacter victoriensis]|jgi:phospholipid transport system transporter-binding protein|uniref:Phospholipid transport system transporter-binding protein n=1 Tax=Polynucleobacter victoriensis TaxID=2049319 RepID=A0A212TAV7_9BURK|nr:STAS domain-containing protein [Polynucleobacter victoriensis]SNC63135.1 phospholipid transport system transporter-binding protein [Polynucleobacter victoriensis]